MKKISEELKEIVKSAGKKLNAINDWNYRTAPDKWSKKEILGHLIDSAANNHQRFVRIQFEDKPTISYEQNKWVKTQNYNDAGSNSLINLWVNYNNHLAYIISQTPKEKYNRKSNIGKEDLVTLEWIVTDYLTHLKHHLVQIVGEL